MDGAPVLELARVEKSYPGFTLGDVSLSLPPGYIMGLVGPNGAGKTTLVRLILGLTRPDGGTVRVFGLDPVEHEVAVRTRLGFVHEVPALYDHLSVARGGVVMGRFYPSWREARFRALLDDFELPPDKRLGTLSHGMRTRFALATALAHDAELLVLDEPTSGLDPVFRRGLLDRLSSILAERRVSILFSSHITSDLDRIADYVTFLVQGRVVFSDRRDRVLDRWVVVKGGLELLTEDTRTLFLGLETGDLGFTGLSDDPAAVRTALPDGAVVVERATLEDIVYLTGRDGPAGVEFHAPS